MRLWVVVVQDEDAGALMPALLDAGLETYAIASTGGFLRRGIERAEGGLEDGAVRLHAAVAHRADTDVDVETVVACELVEVALTVGDEPEPQAVRAQDLERRKGVVVEEEVVHGGAHEPALLLEVRLSQLVETTLELDRAQLAGPGALQGPLELAAGADPWIADQSGVHCHEEVPLRIAGDASGDSEGRYTGTPGRGHASAGGDLFGGFLGREAYATPGPS